MVKMDISYGALLLELVLGQRTLVAADHSGTDAEVHIQPTRMTFTCRAVFPGAGRDISV